MAKDKKNTGTDNTGENNTGNRNSGNGNSGYGNSGYGNSGNRNSGNRNSGNRNSGNGNSGYGNSGNWNSGYGNSGMFNTDEPFMCSFNNPTSLKLSEFRISDAYPDFSDMNPCVWVESSIMTSEEKTAYPSHKTTGGYIKVLPYKEAWAVWKRKCTPENWKKVLALPNFDSQIFEEITGIKVEDNSESKKKAKELREQADVMLAKAKELENSL